MTARLAQRPGEQLVPRAEPRPLRVHHHPQDSRTASAEDRSACFHMSSATSSANARSARSASGVRRPAAAPPPRPARPPPSAEPPRPDPPGTRPGPAAPPRWPGAPPRPPPPPATSASPSPSSPTRPPTPRPCTRTAHLPRHEPPRHRSLYANDIRDSVHCRFPSRRHSRTTAMESCPSANASHSTRTSPGVAFAGNRPRPPPAPPLDDHPVARVPRETPSSVEPLASKNVKEIVSAASLRDDEPPVQDWCAVTNRGGVLAFGVGRTTVLAYWRTGVPVLAYGAYWRRRGARSVVGKVRSVVAQLCPVACASVGATQKRRDR
jgi:hypothetical protein